MAQSTDILVPDIGEATDVEVIEILVNKGDTVSIDDPVIVLESDKASMDVPATAAGMVTGIHVALGDKVIQGARLLSIELDAESAATEPSEQAEVPPPAKLEPQPDSNRIR